MEPAALWQAFVGGAALPILAYWGTQGVSAYVKTRNARRAGVAEDERDAAAEHERHVTDRAEHAERERDDERRLRHAAEERVRQLDDYAHALRADFAAATGQAPRPWPALRSMAVRMIESGEG